MKCKADSISSSDRIESQCESSNPLLAIGLPLALFVFYLFVTYNPWSREAEASAGMSAEESGRLREQCSSLMGAGKYQDALPCVLKLHDAYPGNHTYIEMAAQVYDHLGNYDREAGFWEEYLDRAPIPVTACPRIGQAYWKQGKQKEAIAAFERCLAYESNNSDSIFFLAHALEMSGQPERAGELYERGAKIAPTYTDLQLGRARFLLRHNSNAEALSIALATLAENPKNTDALLVAGIACAQEKQPSRARDFLDRGVKLSDGDSDFHFALARLDEQEKNFGDALVEYERILKLHPDDSVARSRRDALKVKH